MDRLNNNIKNKPTPMLEQYFKIKSKHNDCLLFFRMGDFYELFFNDAIVAAKKLNITLTKRGKYDGKDIPMCGVPVNSGENYLAKLIEGGLKVAVCEQTETPEESKKRGYKSILQRKVMRIVTPGTLTGESELKPALNNYLFTLNAINQQIGVAWMDISTGDVTTKEIYDFNELSSLVTRIMPSEILYPQRLEDQLKRYFMDRDFFLTALPDEKFFYETSLKNIKNFYKISTIDSFGTFSRTELIAFGVMLDYISFTQSGNMPPLDIPRKENSNDLMIMDPSTKKKPRSV